MAYARPLKFVNTRLFSPIALDGLTTAPPDSYEYYDWWKQEEHYCKHGFESGGVKITGIHYFYLNYWMIRAEEKDASGRSLGKRLMRPRFLDMDYEFFWELEEAIANNEDLLVLKRRQAGFSYKHSCIAGHEYTFVPDSHTIITSGHEEFSNNTMRMARVGLNDLSNTEFYKNRYVNSASFIQAGIESVDAYGTKRVEGMLSIIQQITSASPQSMIGKSPSKVIYEEIGKFPGIIDTKAYTDPAMMVGDRKTGIQLLIGTGGEENESIDEVTKMVMNPHLYGLRSYENVWDDPEADFIPIEGKKAGGKVAYFVPAWKFKIIDDDGNSLKEESLEQIMKDRERVKDDKNRFLKELTQFPLTIEEALLVPDGNVFNVMKLREINMSILKYKDLQVERRGEIAWVINERGIPSSVEWIDKFDGRFLMTEPPVRFGVKPDGTGGAVDPSMYVAGTDSYDRDQTASSHGSFGSCLIYRMLGKDLVGDYPVCRLTERPPTAFEFYEDTVKMCMLYGGGVGMNLIEYSNLGIFNWYQTNGFEYLLKERPDIAYANVANPQVQNKYGVDPAVKSVIIQAGVDWVEEYASRLRDTHLIGRLIKYKRDPKYNCDDTIAFCLAILNRDDIISKTAIGLQREEIEKEDRMLGHRYAWNGSRMVRL